MNTDLESLAPVENAEADYTCYIQHNEHLVKLPIDQLWPSFWTLVSSEFERAKETMQGGADALLFAVLRPYLAKRLRSQGITLERGEDAIDKTLKIESARMLAALAGLLITIQDDGDTVTSLHIQKKPNAADHS